MNCIICNQAIGLNHKCTNAAIASYNRRLSAKQSADTRADERRYGATETVGDRIAAGSNFIRLNEM